MKKVAFWLLCLTLAGNTYSQGIYQRHYLTFPQEADFQKRDWRYLMNFEHSVFKKNCDFSEATLLEGAHFQQVIFQEAALFRKCKIAAPTYFDSAIFQRKADFGYLQTSAPISFDHAHFLGITFFWFASFGQKVNFKGCHFEGDVSFASTQFTEADFSQTIFDSDAHFSETEWQSASFEYVKFASGGNFDRALSKVKISFAHAQIAQPFQFGLAYLPDTLDLSFVKIEGKLEMPYGRNPSGHRTFISLWGSEYGDLEIDFSRYQLWFPDHYDISPSEKELFFQNLLRFFREQNDQENIAILETDFKELMKKEKDY